MKTEFKYIYFVKIEDKPKTSVWECRNKNNDGLLGEILWYGPWRQYCFFPEAETAFNHSCLGDIIFFIEGLKKRRKETK